MIHLIWAEAHGRVIGAGDTIPWQVPGEQRIFKVHTLHAVVVMGRRTWDSLPVKPLPDRKNVVLTRNPSWSAPGAAVVHTLNDVGHAEFWVAGGAEIYAAFLPHAAHIVRTRIDLDVAGDRFAPQLGDGWETTATAAFQAPNGVTYTVEDLFRRGPGAE
jgi:dihydrofolate reductase